MAKQTIGVGTNANDGTGDSLRLAFNKVNANFTETYINVSNLANTTNVLNSAIKNVASNSSNTVTAAFNKANASYIYATQIDDNMGYAYENSNVAFDKANGTVSNTRSAFRHANSAYLFSNTLSIQINASSGGLRQKDNLIYTFANAVYNHTNVAYNRTNTVYLFANVVQVRTNASFNHANSGYLNANTGRTHANNAYNQANLAYNYGATLNTSKLSNTDGMSFAGSLYFPLGKLVGVGTNAPLAPLHIRNTTANPIAVFHSEGTQDLSVRFRRGANYEWAITNENTSKDLVFSYGTSYNIFRVTNEGNVGVGIIPTSYKFDVNGTSYFRGTAAFASFVTVAIGAGQTNQKGIYSINPDGIGIHGKVTRGVGGVDGSIGVLGEATVGSGVKGTATSGYAIQGVSTTGTATYSISTSGYGVYGISSSSFGVRGQSASSTGVYGNSTSGYGVYGISTSQIGVYGRSTSNHGVYGLSSSNYGGVFDSTSGNAVLGRSSTGSGVLAQSNATWSLLAGTQTSWRFGVNPSGVIYNWNGAALAPSYSVRAWAYFDTWNNGARGITIKASGNVSSIGDHPGTSFYTLNFITPMPDANYAISGSGSYHSMTPSYAQNIYGQAPYYNGWLENNGAPHRNYCPFCMNAGAQYRATHNSIIIVR